MFGSRVWAMLNYATRVLWVDSSWVFFSEAIILQKGEEGIFLQHCVCIWTTEDKMKLQLLMNSLSRTKIFKGGITPLATGSYRTPKLVFDSLTFESNLNHWGFKVVARLFEVEGIWEICFLHFTENFNLKENFPNRPPLETQHLMWKQFSFHFLKVMYGGRNWVV